MDPHGDGSFRDGVDGFRIDHMMDDLDNKGRLPNLFADFWTPIFNSLKARKSDLRIVAEQSDWGYGEDWLKRGNADLVFAFPLRGALTKLDKSEIVEALSETETRTPAGKSQIVFVENHDTDRFMSLVGDDPKRARAGAAFNILLKGEPLLYYGQEIGMRGRTREDFMADSAHIPLREAFRWTRDVEGPGSAIWYKADRPWWHARYNNSGDGVSVEEQDKDPASLLNWYRALLDLRAQRSEFRTGDQRVLCENAAGLVCVLRESRDGRSVLIANLGSASEKLPGGVVEPGWVDLLGTDKMDAEALTLAPLEVRVIGTPASG